MDLPARLTNQASFNPKRNQPFRQSFFIALEPVAIVRRHREALETGTGIGIALLQNNFQLFFGNSCGRIAGNWKNSNPFDR